MYTKPGNKAALLVPLVLCLFFLPTSGCDQQSAENHKTPKLEIPGEVRGVFDAIENCAKEKKPLIVAMDFDPSTREECGPMAEAILRHCFSRDIRVIVTTFIPSSIDLSKQILDTIAKEMEKRNHEDYVFLGYKPSLAQVILNMGKDFKKAYPTDAAGTDIGLIKAMEGVKNFDDIGLTISISGTPIPETWIFFAHHYYQANVAVGTTAVSATTYYPYFKAGQIKGFLPGISGAAAYRELLRDLPHEE